MSLVRRVVELLALPTIALGAALVLVPDRSGLAVHVWLLVVLSLVLLALMGFARAAYPPTRSAFVAGLRRPAVAAARPGSLAHLEREVSIAGSSAFDEHQRLRPAVAEIAADLLASRRGIDLGREPDRARAVLGDDVWELIRPDRPQPTDKLERGIDEAGLERVVASLERI